MHSKEASFLSSSKVNPELIYINFQFMKKKKEPGLEHYYLQLLLQAFCSHFEPYPLHAGKQVCAYSWLHGDRNWTSTIVSLDWQPLSYAYNIVEFPSVNDKLCWDKNLNNFVLFPSILKNAYQLVGVIEFTCTLHRVPLPRFFLADNFKFTCL